MSRESTNGQAAATKRAWEGLTPSLSAWILEAISTMGFRQMTPVQANTIPLFMGNKDVVVEAVTGSGKTLAFCIPVIEKLLRMDEQPRKHHIGAIIISPTRELASQIFTVLEGLLAFHPPSAAHMSRPDDEDMDVDRPAPTPSVANKIVAQLLLGGNTTPAQDLSTFLHTSPNLIVATPGRLLELLSSQHVHCSQSSFEMLIMDEADRLLDLGFSDTLRKILTRLPKQRRTGLFSASMTEALDQLIRVGLRNPVKIAVRVKSAAGEQDRKTPASLQLAYISCPPTHKLPSMMRLLSSLSPTPQKSVCYLSTCAAVDYWSHILPVLLPADFSLVPLHGKQPSTVRARNFTRFTTSTSPTLLLTTDVAARGLDIPLVDLVLQLDPPSDPKTFVHRCGRAARAGRRGLAVVFLTAATAEESYVPFLALRQTPVAALAGVEHGAAAADAEACTARIREAVLGDRAHHDRAQKAFVSWVRSYGKHAAGAVFSLREVPWVETGKAWGLLKMPRMPELKASGEIDERRGLFCLGVSKEVLDKLAYRDGVREKARLQAMEEYRLLKESGGVVKRGEAREKEEARRDRAWSAKKDGKKTREERREKRTTKRESERRSKLSDEQRAEEERVAGLVSQVRKQTRDKLIRDARGEGEKDPGAEDEWEGFDD